MKLVMLLYLEEDEACVDRFLRESGVSVFSRASIEGVGGSRAAWDAGSPRTRSPSGPGAGAGSTPAAPGPGWYGAPMPYASRMAFAVVPSEQATDLLAAVGEGRGGLDARNHPVRAFQLPIEAVAACGHQESIS